MLFKEVLVLILFTFVISTVHSELSDDVKKVYDDTVNTVDDAYKDLSNADEDDVERWIKENPWIFAAILLGALIFLILIGCCICSCCGCLPCACCACLTCGLCADCCV